MPNSTVLRKRTPTIIKAVYAPMGTIGYLRLGGAGLPEYEGVLVMRCYNTTLVSLENFKGTLAGERFGTTWGSIPDYFKIEVLEKGSVVTITI